MDNPQEWVNLISSVGFPIVACCGLFYLYDKTLKQLVTTLGKMADGIEELLERKHNDGNN
jgi:hypothetical protein